jgi:two-component system, OmpR family, response regulator
VRILVVEDEPKLAALLRRGLAEEGHVVDVAGNGDDAVWMATAVAYEAIVLDVMLPPRDGLEVCRELRSLDVWSPVLMLTAWDGVGDRVAGLDVGADDCLVNPFAFAELLYPER